MGLPWLNWAPLGHLWVIIIVVVIIVIVIIIIITGLGWLLRWVGWLLVPVVG